MSTPRRRLVRPSLPPAISGPNRQAQLQKVRTRMDQERGALTRWMSRLKRAFHAVEKIQQRINRLEKKLTRPEA
jgi:hypothetical protein